jgi:hypothetical protein
MTDKPDHKVLFKEAEKAIRTLIGDTRVPASQTKQELKELREILDLWIVGLA